MSSISQFFGGGSSGGGVPIGAYVDMPSDAGNIHTVGSQTFLRSGISALASSYPTVPSNLVGRLVNGESLTANNKVSLLPVTNPFTIGSSGVNHYKIASNGSNLFLAFNPSQLETVYWYSTDGGTTFQFMRKPDVPGYETDAQSVYWKTVSFVNGYFIVFTSSGTWRTADCVTWTQLTSVNYPQRTKVVNDKLWLFSPNTGSTTTSILYTTDGSTWASTAMPVAAAWSSCTYTGSTWYVIGVTNGSTYGAQGSFGYGPYGQTSGGTGLQTVVYKSTVASPTLASDWTLAGTYAGKAYSTANAGDGGVEIEVLGTTLCMVLSPCNLYYYDSYFDGYSWNSALVPHYSQGSAYSNDNGATWTRGTYFAPADATFQQQYSVFKIGSTLYQMGIGGLRYTTNGQTWSLATSPYVSNPFTYPGYQLQMTNRGILDTDWLATNGTVYRGISVGSINFNASYAFNLPLTEWNFNVSAPFQNYAVQRQHSAVGNAVTSIDKVGSNLVVMLGRPGHTEFNGSGTAYQDSFGIGQYQTTGEYTLAGHTEIYYTTADYGVTWTQRPMPLFAAWDTAGMGAGGYMYASPGMSGSGNGSRKTLFGVNEGSPNVDNRVYRTLDGINWTQVTTPSSINSTSRIVKFVQCSSTGTMAIFRNANTIISDPGYTYTSVISNDNGVTWGSAQNFYSMASGYSIYYSQSDIRYDPTTSTVYFVGAYNGSGSAAYNAYASNATIYKKTDGGTWNSFAYPAIPFLGWADTTTGYYFGASGCDVLYISSLNRWIISMRSSTVIAYTDNQGSTWTTIRVDDTPVSTTSIPGGTKMALNSSNGNIYLKSSNRIYISKDNGTTWSKYKTLYSVSSDWNTAAYITLNKNQHLMDMYVENENVLTAYNDGIRTIPQGNYIQNGNYISPNDGVVKYMKVS